MGVPREPIQWVEDARGACQIRPLNNPTLCVSEALQTAALPWIEQLSTIPAAILKARSPSCGVASAPVHNQYGRAFDVTDGIFLQCLKQRLPGIGVVDESYFE